MTTQPHDRRESDKNMDVLANKIENLSDNIVKLEIGFAEVTKAIVKFSLVEERQTQIFISLDRTTLLIDRWMLRQEAHEKSCAQQDKELRALIADAAKDAAEREAKVSEVTDGRIDALKEDVAVQKLISGWAVAGAGTALGAVVMYFVPKILERAAG